MPLSRSGDRTSARKASRRPLSQDEIAATSISPVNEVPVPAKAKPGPLCDP